MTSISGHWKKKKKKSLVELISIFLKKKKKKIKKQASEKPVCVCKRNSTDGGGLAEKVDYNGSF